MQPNDYLLLLDTYLALKNQLESVDIQDHIASKKAGHELKKILPIFTGLEKIKTLTDTINYLQDSITQENDSMLCELLTEEIICKQQEIQKLITEVDELLLAKDEIVSNSIIVEIRAGTGGDEASLFGQDLWKMYMKYADLKKWKYEMLSLSSNEVGGIKSCAFALKGSDVYKFMKFENGVHRVQRIPTTEANGRIHTSTVTVAILPTPENIEINVQEKDLRIDTYRASGAGGQHVNKTDSAVRITHIPSGVVVQCQDERSQHENRARCMKILEAKLYESILTAQQEKTQEERTKQIGTGSRSEKSRTYNYPQNRITDHVFNITLYKLNFIVQEGNLDLLINELITASRLVKH